MELLRRRMSSGIKSLPTPLEVEEGTTFITPSLVPDKRSRSHARKVGAYKCIEMIGSGVAGEVYMVTNQGEPFALKVVDSSKRSRIAKSFQKEVLLHALCHEHPNVLTCYEFMKHGSHFFLATDLAEQGDSFDFVQDCGGILMERVAHDLISQVLEAVAHIHSIGVCHRDIKPENLLITDKGRHLELCDFGYAVQWTEGDKLLSDTAGTVRCLSPEMIEGSYDPSKCDVWACGVVLYYFLTGQFPFDGEGDRDTLLNIKQRRFTYPLPRTLSQSAKDFVLTMLEPCPNKRPTAKELLDHPFITQRRLSCSA